MRQLAAIVLLVSSVSSMASSCWTPFHLDQLEDPLAFAINHSDLIFTGTADKRTTLTFESANIPPAILEEQVQFIELSLLKGEAGEVVIVENFSSECSCHYEYELGREYIVLASRINTNGYRTFNCSYIGPLDSSEKLMAEIKRNLSETSSLSDLTK